MFTFCCHSSHVTILSSTWENILEPDNTTVEKWACGVYYCYKVMKDNKVNMYITKRTNIAVKIHLIGFLYKQARSIYIAKFIKTHVNSLNPLNTCQMFQYKKVFKVVHFVFFGKQPQPEYKSHFPGSMLDPCSLCGNDYVLCI